MIGSVQSAVDQVDLGPVSVLDQPVELGPPVRADGDDECTMADLRRKADAARIVDELDVVDGEAPWRAAQLIDQHRDLGGVGSEVGVQVFDLGVAQPGFDAARLGQVGEMDEQRTIRMAAHAPGER